MTPHNILAGLTGLLLVAHVGDIDAQQRDAITIRAAQSLSPRMQDVLVQVGATTDVTVAAGRDPYESLRTFCGGSFTNDYAHHVRKLNEAFSFQSSAIDRTLKLPPCAKLAKNVNVMILPGDDVDSISRRTFGVPSNTTVQVCDPKDGKPALYSSCKLSAGAALAAINGGKALEPATLVPGKTITAQTVGLPTTFALKEGVEASMALQLLKAAMAAQSVGAAIDAAPSADLKLIQPLKSESPLIVGTSCDASAGASASWPIDPEAVLAKLRSARQIATIKGVFLGPSVIRVADTGFLGISSFFSEESIVQNTLETADQKSDLDGNKYIADRYGIDAENRGDISPYPDDPHKMHGTQVADVALGGSTLRTRYPAVYELVKVSFAKIYWKGAGAITVKDDAFLQSLRHIDNHSDPRVVNLSVGAGDENSTRYFEDAVRASTQLNFLVVIAAGNDTNDISSVPMYPASYGGTGSDFSSALLTVGASSPDAKLAPFSNHSRTRVDLLAPGCRIPFAMNQENPEFLHGTSVAAPLVSFVAAALRSLGISRMQQVKLRLIASANFDHALSDQTRYGGVILNPERALSFFDDVIRVKGASTDILGTWQRPDDGIQLCRDGELLNPARVLAVSSYVDKGVPRLRLLQTEAGGRLGDTVDCVAAEGAVDFVANDGAKFKVSINDITTLVPAYPYAKK